MTAGSVPLPPLREDLQILNGGTSYSGAPVWVIVDPTRNRFFRITFEMFQLLSLWNLTRTLDGLNRALAARFGRTADMEEIGAVVKLLENNMLLTRPASGSWRTLYDVSRRRHSWFMRLIHNYLFFKIPLVRPEPFIRATWPYVSLLFSRWFLFSIVLIGVTGLYLVSRQWDAFIGTFPYVFSLEGAAISILSIVLIKSMHELGHAYVAHRHGCRIPSMGLAFMVMVPMLYTDVTDAWRLKSRKSRMMIDSAGVATELCVAAVALFLWVFIPDGALRSAVFVLAATGWIMSLIVNTSPFMRFDGYYMLADFLGIENLQTRAFRHMRWRLKEFLFGLGYPAPEPFPPRLDVTLTIYAICTAIYRLTLYLGIALLVYHFTIKLVGIMLFAVEIGFFIIRPVWMEFKEWWGLRGDIVRSWRTYLTLAILAGLLFAVSMPLSTRVTVPALIVPETFVRLFPEEEGRVERIDVSRGQMVGKGDVLFVISSPTLAQERGLAEIELAVAARRLARIGADAEDLADKGLLETEIDSLRAKRDGLAAREERLIIRAPFAGRIVDLNPDIAPGQWVSRKLQFAFLAGSGGMVARGYVAGDDRARIAAGATGWFIPDDLSQPRLAVSLADVSVSGARQIEIPQITSQFGGPIAVHPSSNGRLIPVTAQYAVSARALGDAAEPEQTRRGVLLLKGSAESYLARMWRQVLKVLVREAGA